MTVSSDQLLDDMIAYFLGDSLFPVKNKAESFLQAFTEKVTIMICQSCLAKGEFYFDGHGTLLCKHHAGYLLREYLQDRPCEGGLKYSCEFSYLLEVNASSQEDAINSAIQCLEGTFESVRSFATEMNSQILAVSPVESLSPNTDRAKK